MIHQILFIFIMLIKSILAIAFLLYLPGYAILKLFAKPSQNVGAYRDTPLQFHLSEVHIISINISIILTTLIGLILAENIKFSIYSLIIINIIIYVILLIISKLKKCPQLQYQSIPKNENLFILISMIFVIIIGTIYHSEDIMGRKDAGVYISTGINLANTGSIRIKDELISKYGFENTDVFLIDHKDALDGKPRWERFAGFYVYNQDGTIVPQFFHTYQVWVAIFYALWGIYGALFLNTFFSMLSLLSIFYFVKNITNSSSAFFSVIILITNAIQLWFSRLPSNEMFLQYLFFTGLYLYNLSFNEDKKYLAVFSAISFGASFLIKTSCWLCLPVLIFFFFLNTIKNKNNRYNLIAFLTILIFFVLAFLYGIIYTDFYLYGLYRHFIRLRYPLTIFQTLLAFIAVIIDTIIATYILYKFKILKLVEKKSLRLFIIAVLIISLIVIYVIQAKHIETTNIWSESSNLVQIGWYFSIPGLILLLIGLALMIYRKNGYGYELFLLIFFSSALFLVRKHIANEHIWATRRWAPIVVPSFAIFIGYSLGLLYEKKQVLTKLASIILLISILVLTIVPTRHIVFHKEYNGTIKFLNEFEKRFEKGSYILYDQMHLLYMLALPMHYWKGYTAVLLEHQSDPQLNYKVTENVEKWLSEKKNVYFISTFDIPTIQGDEWTLKKKDFIDINLPVLEQALNKFPKNIIREKFRFYIYQYISKPFSEGTFNIQIGKNDVGFIMDFYDVSKLGEDRTFRWTQKDAYVSIGRLWAKHIDKNKSYNLKIKLWGGRTPDVPKAKVIIKLDEKVLDEFIAENEPKEYTFEINAEQIHYNSVLQISSDVWEPIAGKGFLGVCIEYIKIEEVL